MQLLTVLNKEIHEALRDRRSLMSALLTPALMPLFLILMMHLSIEKSISRPEEILTLRVSGGEHAPNLVQHLRQNKFRIKELDLTEKELQQAIKNGDYASALYIPASYAEEFGKGRPARLKLIQDTSNSDIEKILRRIDDALYQYSRKIAVLRLQIRGISPYNLKPIVLEDVEVSTTDGTAFQVLASIPFFLFIVTLMGGFYQAIDSTAGERERGSLEPLLALPVSRAAIVMGKILATSLFMFFSLVLVIVVFVFSLGLIDFAALGVSVNFDFAMGAKIGFLMLPFAFFGATLMTFVASFTKSYKEAQTYLSIVIMIPTMPMLFIMMYSLKAEDWMMFIPCLNQGLLITVIFKEEALNLLHLALSMISTTGFGLLLSWLIIKRYEQEKILN